MKNNKLLLTLLSALLLALSRLPLHLGWLAFVGWLPLLFVFENLENKSRDLLQMGLVMSVVYCALVFYWLIYVNVGALVGVMLFYVFAYYLVFYAINRIFQTLPRFACLGFVSVLITFEFIQNFGETRFPWFNQAYSLADYDILIQAADLIGVVGISILIMAVNLLLHKALKARKQPRKMLPFLAGIALIFAAWLGYGGHCLKNLELTPHDAGIYVMQPSIPQDVKWDSGQYKRSLETFRKLTFEAKADSARLIIWPEGAMVSALAQSSQGRYDMRELVQEAQIDIYTGFQHYIEDAAHPLGVRSYNASSLFGPDNFDNPIYFKNILVPVGERMLWLKVFPFLWKLNLGQANWEFGTELVWQKCGGYSFSPSICYELAFPEIFHRMALPRDSLSSRFQKQDYLVNITNDAWFGSSYGPWLHAVMTRFRAVENRIQIYRSANTGISMIVDPKGKILTQTRLFEVKNISAPLYTTPKIPFIRRIHRYPFIFVAVALVLALLARFRKSGGAK
ncbi:MAG: apolipoprotein N-acyltransferase [Candidatus Cloacimonadaceae bacterium]|jgi:apolipoprotein N-acyltransferase|nr:apolipoprotein N-acyltransferase [Candidatus Cloacimonadota bacterium]